LSLEDHKLDKAASLPRPLRFQGRFASKAASLPRPLRYQARTKLKLTMKNMKGMKFSYSSCPLWLNIFWPKVQEVA
jgi:hypothetical protein